LLVIDTNVVLDLLHFDDATARPLRLALEAGRVRCAVSDATLEELRRVLAYPEFGLDEARQAGLFARYQALAVAAAGAAAVPGLPRCGDPDDQKFIELAAAVQAQTLVSKDRAVLKLRRRCAPWFRVMSPAEAVRWLDERPA
jgi:putative PIN family toxin of toxin-antitoxin system